MFRPSETTEVSMEETHHHVLQFVYGTRNLWRQGPLDVLRATNGAHIEVY